MIETRIKTMQVEVWKEKITRTLRPIRHQEDDEKEDEVSDPTYEGDSNQKDERARTELIHLIRKTQVLKICRQDAESRTSREASS